MRWHARRLLNQGSFLHRNRAGAAACAALYGFGLMFGHALYRALYQSYVDRLLSAAMAQPEGLPLGSMLLFSVAPAFLYGCCLLLCALERRALPLWGLCLLIAGFCGGLGLGLLLALGAWWGPLMCLPLVAGQAALALLALDARASMADVYAVVERFMTPVTVYLVAVSAIHILLAVLLGRSLFH
ncbi:MAG: hypothetical protein Q4C13_02180 [Clostridia bacterium]|nr:hypothetical protein [Clostridia bacterium]